MSWLVWLLRRLKPAAVWKGYDYWVTSALAEADPVLKARYLARALKLNPNYLPAWGLRANALFDAGQYAEAVSCFDKALEARPSALLWYKKGVCCHHLNRRQEAIACFAQAVQACPPRDRKLLEEVWSMKNLVEYLEEPPNLSRG